MTPGLSRAQDSKDRPVKYVRGRIYSINWAGSKIVIQWFYSTKKLSEDKMTFFIPDDVQVVTDKVKIFKPLRPAGITDLVEGDHVIIKYYDDMKKGNPEARNIKVLEHDRPIAP